MWVKIIGNLKSGVKYDCIPKGEHDKLQTENKRLRSKKHITLTQAREMALFTIERGKERREWLDTQDENKRLKNLLGELYDEVSYEWAGEWVIEDRELMKRVKQALK